MKVFFKKAVFSLFALSVLLIPAFSQVTDGEFSQGVPEFFKGVWERPDRYVMFAESDDFLSNENSGGSSSEGPSFVSIMLKTFYGWYLDRTAEPASFESEGRVINDSTSPSAENISIEYRPLATGSAHGGPVEGSGSVWELFVHYPGLRDAVVVPVAIIGQELYLDFAVRLDEEVAEEDNDRLLGFWCKMARGNGIKVSPPCIDHDIYSTYITKDAVYTIRYWLTDMPYTNERAFFSDGGKTYSVVKHIQSAGKVFTCAQGRRVTIRNVQKTNDRPSVYRLDSSGLVCGLGEPYLKRVQDQNSIQAVLGLFKKYYAQRAPNPDPPFGPSNLDWHMDDINRLEAGNEIVQKVRARQKEFAQKYGRHSPTNLMNNE